MNIQELAKQINAVTMLEDGIISISIDNIGEHKRSVHMTASFFSEICYDETIITNMTYSNIRLSFIKDGVEFFCLKNFDTKKVEAVIQRAVMEGQL